MKSPINDKLPKREMDLIKAILKIIERREIDHAAKQ